MNMALSVAQAEKIKTTNAEKRATTIIFQFQSENRRKCLNLLAGRAGKTENFGKWCRTSVAWLKNGAKQW